MKLNYSILADAIVAAMEAPDFYSCIHIPGFYLFYIKEPDGKIRGEIFPAVQKWLAIQGIIPSTGANGNFLYFEECDLPIAQAVDLIIKRRSLWLAWCLTMAEAFEAGEQPWSDEE